MTDIYSITEIFTALAALFLLLCLVLLVVINRRLVSGLQEMVSLSLLLKNMALGITASLATGTRLEQTAKDVATDLSEAHARANAIVNGSHGEAADAAVQQSDTDLLISNGNTK